MTAAGRQPGERGEIAAGFGVACAHQHAARLRHDREHMAGLHDVRGLGVLRDRHLHRARAVVGRNSGGHALGGFDRQSEIGAQRQPVVAHHERQGELAAAFLGQREADETARELRHEVDRLGRDVLCSEHQIALVFAVFLVDEHDHAAGFDLGDDLGDWTDGCGFAPHETLRSLRGQTEPRIIAPQQNKTGRSAPRHPTNSETQAGLASAATGAAGASAVRISPAASACARVPSFSLIRADLPERWRR